MIRVENLTKSYRVDGGRHYVYKNVNVEFPEGRNIGIIGSNGAGKSTFLRLLGGIDFPDSGRIISNKSFSWPLGLKGGFVGHMTGRANCRMVCNIYGLPYRQIAQTLGAIEEMADIGEYFDEPVKYYSSGMSGRLGFALSMSFDFDYFLIDEITSVGDVRFKALAKSALEKKALSSRVIMVSHNMSDLKKFCDVAVLIRDGEIDVYDDIEEGIAVYDAGLQLEQFASSEDEPSDLVVGERVDSKVVPRVLREVTLPGKMEEHVRCIESGLLAVDRMLPDLADLSDASALRSLATVYEGGGSVDRARLVYLRQVECGVGGVRPLLKLAKIAQQSGDTAMFLEYIRKAEAIDSDHGQLLLMKIRAALANNGVDEALDISERGILMHSKNAVFHLLHSKALQQSGQIDLAIAAQLRAIDLAPTRKGYYTGLSQLYAASGDFSLSQKALLQSGASSSNESEEKTLDSLAKLAEEVGRLKRQIMEQAQSK
jgi:capsular polysaccharide transport system ATP-binding protein